MMDGYFFSPEKNKQKTQSINIKSINQKTQVMNKHRYTEQLHTQRERESLFHKNNRLVKLNRMKKTNFLL